MSKDWIDRLKKLKVEKDGNKFCCHGLGFINLQKLDNYAFGETYEESIENYMQQRKEREQLRGGQTS